jgi:hypothetical protein
MPEINTEGKLGDPGKNLIVQSSIGVGAKC